MWLLNRLFDQGDQPTPRFAFQGTVNWMRALSIYCDANSFSHDSLRNFYSNVQRRPANNIADTLAFECLTMSMHNVDAIDSMEQSENPYSVVRSAIIAWYYATYYGAKAMLAASSGANPQTHASAGKIFQSELIEQGLAKSPFNLSLSNLTPTNIESEINLLRDGNGHDLNTVPDNNEMAFGALCSYLKGTAEYEKWRLEEQVKESSEYKRGGFNSFRTNAARALRDAKLTPAKVNYLVQAFRYRGKANYRDAIYLSYGEDRTDQLAQFINDLGIVSGAFSLMVAHYISKRVVRDDWNSFVQDLDNFIKFELPYELSEI